MSAPRAAIRVLVIDDHQVQGFLYATPMRFDDLDTFLATN